MDTGMHKENQQATGGPTSLGVTSKARVNPQLSSGMSAFNLNEPIYSTSFIIHSKPASGNDALAASTAEANPGNFAPSNFIHQQQGLETVLTQPITGKGARSVASQIEEETSNTIKLEDLAKLVDEDKDDEVHATKNVETKDISVPKSSSPRSSQVQELTNQVLILQSQKYKLELEKNKAEAEAALLKVKPSFPMWNSSKSCCSLPTELKYLPSKFDELTEEVIGLKKQVHELEIELPGDLKEIPTNLEDFTKTVASVQAKLKSLDALLGLLLNVTKALNKFAQVLDSASSKAGDQSVPSAGQADTRPAEGEKDTNQVTISQLFQRIAEKNDEDNLNKNKPQTETPPPPIFQAGKESTDSDSDDETHVTGSMVEPSRTKKLKKFDFITEDGRHIHLTEEEINHQKKLEEDAKAEAAKQKKEVRKAELVNLLGPEVVKKKVMKACLNRTGKGWEIIYKQIGTRMDYIHTTKAELGINLDIPLSKQGPLDKLNDLANKKRKHADDIHDYFKENKRLKSSVHYKDHLTGTMLNEHVLGMIINLLQMTSRSRTFSSFLLAKIDKRNLNPLKQMRVIEQLRLFVYSNRGILLGLVPEPFSLSVDLNIKSPNLCSGTETEEVLWKELQFSLVDNSKLNVSLSSKEITLQLSFNHLAIPQARFQGTNSNLAFDHAKSASFGNSGCILCVWDSDMFIKEHVSSSDYFLAVMGIWTPSSIKLLVISVYAPQQLSEKRELWGYLHSLINRWDGEAVILGDFNEVRSEQERFGSSFNIQSANAFNNFISMTGLIDLPLGGYSFTWAHKLASKMSKLDRILISEGLMVLFPHLSGLCLDRKLSNHRPIIMCESNLDYGLTPFHIFHSWFKMEGFDSFVEDSWHSMDITDLNALTRMKKKLQLLKKAIKTWVKQNKKKINEAKSSVKCKLTELDKLIDQGLGNKEVVNQRVSLIKDLNDINSIDVSELSQKAKVRWSIEGDENSKYFHGILNSKRSQLTIRGILLDGDWIRDPNKFPNRLNLEQVEELERSISYDEIKKAVWDCGTNKSPAVPEFFASGKFPPGCNSTFITLIPKIHDAKVIKDFHSISLIESIYKIVARIMANRLCLVMPDLISDVQTVFVSNHQILDSPFILNELLAWCKHKKSFGFGDKWRSWISGCLNSAKGSVLNYKWKSYFGISISQGLKQGISINNSLMISYLFYADDAVFVGKWDISNINTIVHVLKCFFLDSGLKINIHKSMLMGIGVYNEDVITTPSIVGCFTFSPLFNYLGVKVRASMSRLNSWNEVIDKFSSRLSNWKLKTLSIGGRLTLLKSILTAAPLYHMSLYKAPVRILNRMESIGRDIFNGIDTYEKKIAWVGWEKFYPQRKMEVSVFPAFMLLTVAFFSNGFGVLSPKILLYDLVCDFNSLNRKESRKDISVAEKLRHSEEQYNGLCSMISYISLPNMSDRWFWSLDGSGEFSVRSVRCLIDDVLLPKSDTPTRFPLSFVPYALKQWNPLPIYFSHVLWLDSSCV
ncbi:RNA-directed DNA polymerase, eukaryota [Tanacetum coccineum]